MANILIADDDTSIRKLVAHTLEKAGHSVFECADGKAAIDNLNDEFDLAVLDLKMPFFNGIEVLENLKKNFPSIEVIMLSAIGNTKDIVSSIKTGAFWYLDKPFDNDEFIALVSQALKLSKLQEQNKSLKSHLKVSSQNSEVIGNASVLLEIENKIEKIKDLDESILITGQSGTGKSMLARNIHSRSKRKDESFITISCANIPRELLEAEIFGHEKGAFTGATNSRAGAVEIANGGTLFLDEIGDLPFDLQPKLLVFLQDKIYKRVGSSKEKKASVRIIAATHQNLEKMCQENKFRNDLFFRLNVFSLTVPSLSERKEDIDLLVSSYLEYLAEKRNVTKYEIDSDAIKKLKTHNWPGNIRELQNVLERASAFCDNFNINENNIEIANVNHKKSIINFNNMKLSEIEILAIKNALEVNDGNRKLAAEQLGITQKTIYNKLKKLGLSE